MAAPVPLRGTLERHSFITVLRALNQEGRDGCLTVERGAISRRVYLREGMIIYASSTERQDRLGEILVAQGRVTRADHKKYWEQSKAGNRLLGITLLLNGRITLTDLYQGVTAQVVTILDRLQKWRKGDYAFEEGAAPAVGTVLLRIPLALYLRADTEKKAPAKKGKGAVRGAAAPEPEEPPAPSALPVPPVAAAAAGATEDEEQELDLHAAAAGEEPVDAAAVRDVEEIAEISFVVQELRKRLGQDPFTLLGVSVTADRATVQAAYHRIAKVLHPDRLPPSCPAELAHDADEIYREVTAAVQAAEEGLRATDASAASAAAPAPRARGALSPEDQARRLFGQGREWITKRNYWQAADALRQAVRLMPEEALYRQYLGLTLLQTKRMHEAEEHLTEAARLEPTNAAHFLNLGRVYKNGRLLKKAREAFERALRIDPGNEHARDELRELPSDRPAAPKAEPSIFKKLFGIS